MDNEDIFTETEVEESTGGLRFLRKAMNGIHFNTRKYVIRRELLFHTGEAFDPARLEETERNLRTLGYLNNISITPVDTTADGRVKVEIRTRETWTLRTSVSFSLASGGDARWSVQLADRNFLGHGVEVGAGVGQDENSSYWDVWYRQRRLFGPGLWLGIDYSDRQDGHVSRIQLGKPFYSLGDHFGMDARVWDTLYDQRFYLSNAGPAGIDPGATSSLYAPLPVNTQGVDLRFQWRVSDTNEGRVWRVGGGYHLQEQIMTLQAQGDVLSDGRLVDLDFLTEEGEPFARDTGITSRPFVWIRTMGRRWAKERFLMQYGPVEDVPMDFILELTAGPSGGTMGSTTGYGDSRFSFEGRAENWKPFAGGTWLFNVYGFADVGSPRVQSYAYDLTTGWVGTAGHQNAPWITRLFAEYGQGQNLLGTRALLLGLDKGIRTLDFDGQAGDRLMRWNAEQGKAMPWEVLGFVRMGFAAFYSGGRAWWDDEIGPPPGIRNELGAGLRFGPTRSANGQIARIDLAWDLAGSGNPVITATSRGFF